VAITRAITAATGRDNSGDGGRDNSLQLKISAETGSKSHASSV